jgi:hypothetical protein
MDVRACVWAALALFPAICLGGIVDAPSVVRVGRDVVVTERQFVEDAVSIGGNVTVRGAVRGNAVAVGGSVILEDDGYVDGDVVAVGGAIEGERDTRVGGDIVEIGVPGAGLLRGAPGGAWRGVFWGARLIGFIGFLALGLLLVALFPRAIDAVANAAESRPGKSMLWGVIGLLALAPLAVALVVSIVGIVLIPLEIVLYIAAFVFGYIAVAKLVGSRIAAGMRRGEIAVLWRTVIGLLALWLASMIPFAGLLIKSIVALFGLGAILVALFERYRGAHAGEGR